MALFIVETVLLYILCSNPFLVQFHKRWTYRYMSFHPTRDMHKLVLFRITQELACVVALDLALTDLHLVV